MYNKPSEYVFDKSVKNKLPLIQVATIVDTKVEVLKFLPPKA